MSASAACVARAATALAERPLAAAVLADSGQNVMRCNQCYRCTSGCPLAERFDLAPSQVVRALQRDDTRVLKASAPWLCASCYLCSERCPQSIDVAAVMKSVAREARRRGLPAAVPEVERFGRMFLRVARALGRVHEGLLAAWYGIASRRPLADQALGRGLVRRGRLRLVPRFVRPPRAVAVVEDPRDKVAYFPGCAGESSALEYDRTARATARALGIELIEPPGWTCCGASPAASLEPALGIEMPRRTLDTIERMGLDTVTSPCSACFVRLQAGSLAPSGIDPRRPASVKVATTTADEPTEPDVDKPTRVRVAHLLDVLVERAGIERIEASVERPLTDLKLACYYGCLITRPSRLTEAAHPERPRRMEQLVEALGASTVEWDRKLSCCGNSLSVSRPEYSRELTARVLTDARLRGAEAVVTMCPLCHLNLDARQRETGIEGEIPVFHATQLTTLAFGGGEREAMLGHNFVDPRRLLERKGLAG
jgi:heterodisulfide reductase subunit B